MGYRNLQECVADLEKVGQLRRIDVPVDPYLELAHIQRRAFRSKSPALLFTRVKGCSFPMLANLFGTAERLHYIVRDSRAGVEAVLAAKADPAAALKHPLRSLRALPALPHMLPRRTSKAPVLENRCALSALPRLVGWPMDGRWSTARIPHAPARMPPIWACTVCSWRATTTPPTRWACITRSIAASAYTMPRPSSGARACR